MTRQINWMNPLQQLLTFWVTTGLQMGLLTNRKIESSTMLLQFIQQSLQIWCSAVGGLVLLHESTTGDITGNKWNRNVFPSCK